MPRENFLLEQQQKVVLSPRRSLRESLPMRPEGLCRFGGVCEKFWGGTDGLTDQNFSAGEGRARGKNFFAYVPVGGGERKEGRAGRRDGRAGGERKRG